MTSIGIILARRKTNKEIHQEKRRIEAAFLLGRNSVFMSWQAAASGAKPLNIFGPSGRTRERLQPR